MARPGKLLIVALLALVASSCQQPPRFTASAQHASAALGAVDRIAARASTSPPETSSPALLPASARPASKAATPDPANTAATTASSASAAIPGEPVGEPHKAPATAVTAAGETTQDPAAMPQWTEALQGNLWAVMRNSFALEHHLEDPSVQAEIRWFKRHPNYFAQRARAFATYMPYVLQELHAYGIPGELALMPVIESALDPYAFSPGGAAGLWQFIDMTAERFGLERNWWYDGRRDVIASTDAAISYLSFLHQSFDDWLLVMAGYNAGEGSVRRAVRKSKAKGAKARPDFFALPLPQETRQYVPRILAYAAVIAEPERYGVTLPKLAFEPGFSTLELPAQFDLMKVSELLGLSLEELYRWNPSFNQWATPAAGPHRLILPPGTDLVAAAEQFQGIPEKERMGWKIVTVKRGDSLSTLAHRNGTRSAAIRKINRLKSDMIREGQQLYIPKSKQAATSYPIARLHGDRTHTVRAGDSLWKLARKHEVSISQLVRWNELNPKAPLRVGQTLHVGKTSRSVMRKVRYRVRSGDSLSRIAAKFNVRTADIASWNGLDQAKYLKPGQRLTLHVNVAKGAPATSAVGL